MGDNGPMEARMWRRNLEGAMAALTVYQRALVAAKVGRCAATRGIATIASLENAVAKSVAHVGQQFLKDRELVSAASKAFEERIFSELTSRVYERIGIVTSRVTEVFIAEKAEMTFAVQNLEGVLEAIGGERFQ